jgi:adenylate cyclase
MNTSGGGRAERRLAAILAADVAGYYAFAYAVRGIVLAYLNRPDEAIAAAKRAIRLSPNDPIIFNAYLALCLAHMVAGRYEEALSWADRAWGSNALLVALRLKLSLLGHLGRRDEAGECLQRLREIYPEPTVIAVMRGAGISPELAARIAEGLRKAGLPEK